MDTPDTERALAIADAEDTVIALLIALNETHWWQRSDRRALKWLEAAFRRIHTTFSEMSDDHFVWWYASVSH